jgi:hypothetical protein
MRRPTRLDLRSWRVALLPLPKGRTTARALCFAGEDVLGLAEARRIGTVPCLWTAGAPEVIREPPGFEAWHGARGELVGRLVAGEQEHAALRVARDGGFVITDLHPAGYARSYATGCADGQQVGYGQPDGQPGPAPAIERALLWAGTGGSVVELAGPDPTRQTRALAVSGGVQVGEYGRNFTLQAAMWRGSAQSMVALHPVAPAGYPPDVQTSAAYGAGDGQQVGVVAWKKKPLAAPDLRAALWTGSAESFVDLTPVRARHAQARACAGGFQVGWVSRLADFSMTRAVLWHGSAIDAIDLHAPVPKPWNRSAAADIQVEGGRVRILGTVSHMVQEGHLDVKRAEQIVVWETTLGSA